MAHSVDHIAYRQLELLPRNRFMLVHEGSMLRLAVPGAVNEGVLRQLCEQNQTQRVTPMHSCTVTGRETEL